MTKKLTIWKEKGSGSQSSFSWDTFWKETSLKVSIEKSSLSQLNGIQLREKSSKPSSFLNGVASLLIPEFNKLKI